jgi:hypothetical protein
MVDLHATSKAASAHLFEIEDMFVQAGWPKAKIGAN